MKMKPIASKTSRGWLALYTDGTDTFPVVDERYEIGEKDENGRFGVPTVICETEEEAIKKSEEYILNLDIRDNDVFDEFSK